MNEETNNWLNMVDYDIDTAEQMLKTGRYVYVIFMCHLAIEKALKAVVCEETNKMPPKTHDLIILINMSKVKISEELLDFIGMINNAAVVTRYPEDLSRLISSYPREIAKDYFIRTLEVIKCIRQDRKLKK
ncbi:MAG: HEPN domain-containing protein [Candidatus Omnitrophica bacterium]|nr:HEPN domain-containing protein [Candidatus Omnitrophota bacterium]MBU0878927.1 HEPN domain-containing protein [Candidatus Omnitrophota bacterium]MBU0896738.1 HEPN domain-containing protein [Candidatus Omnitrophota bacterium]MBU1134382.1 HEPN domain-containing protein [Candidatus Omnitrophota bacterium]MBU1810001.1 HEPN domain-containing protein [Candidatus Omnitrophota bacterium]